MKRLTFSCLLLVIMLASTACGTPTPAPTATPEPATSTPVPSDTPAPTSTNTPLPTNTATSTPDKTATAAVQATEAASTVIEELDTLLAESDIPYKDGQLVWKQNQPVSISLDQTGFSYFQEVDSKTNPVASNFIVKADVKWETTGIIFCGLSFRTDEDDLKEGKQYQFWYMRLSGAPAWTIAFNDQGRYKNSFTGTKYSKALNLENGSTNQIAIVAQDEEFTVFINGTRQGKYYDNSKQAQEGTFTFMAYEDSGKSTCTFSNSWVWALPEEK